MKKVRFAEFELNLMSVIVSFSAASYLSPATFSYHVAVLAFTSSIFID